jgi:hypothetical protein
MHHKRWVPHPRDVLVLVARVGDHDPTRTPNRL